MADVLTPSPRDFNETRFPFHPLPTLTMDSVPSLSPDCNTALLPGRNIKENGHAHTLPNGKPRSGSNNNISSLHHGHTMSFYSSGTSHTTYTTSRSGCSSADSVSSGGSSVNSVFYREKSESASTPNPYVTEPSCKQGNGKKNLVSKLNALKNRCQNDVSETSLKGKAHFNEEVTYTVTGDNVEDGTNQVVFLPPPPADLDSDNDSVAGCEIVGPCSPRHHDWMASRDLSKSPSARTMHANGNNKCLCCMLLLFVISTAGLAVVLVIIKLGKLQMAPGPPGLRSLGDKVRAGLGDRDLVKEVCETPVCMKTASSILSRMNSSANPCQDFYTYACGGYTEEVDLSWFRTRLREAPDEIIHEHRKFIIDRLSTSYGASDNRLVSASRKIFRSCLFRSSKLDDRTKALVGETIESLGGLITSSNDANDVTLLLANVTRLFGASPFFKVTVHNDKNISLISTVSEHSNPWTTPRDYSRDRVSTNKKDTQSNLDHLNDMLVQLIRPAVNETDAKAIVDEFLRLEAHIRRILSTSQDTMAAPEDGSLCAPYGTRKSLGELQVNYNGFSIDWFVFLQHVLDTQDLSDVYLCQVRLSLELQHLLKITPKATIRQFVILHTLIHSDLFLVLSNTQQPLVQTEDGQVLSKTQEEQCLDIILHFLPSLEKYSGCDENALYENRGKAFNTLTTIRQALTSVLTNSLQVPEANAVKVTDESVGPVKATLARELVSRCQDIAGPVASFDEYSFTGNMLKLIQYHHGEYFRGRLSLATRDLDLSALWIAASVQDTHRPRSGPIIYPSPVPEPVSFGSLGSFLASQVAKRLDRSDLLEYHSKGLFNHTVVLGLAFRLKCLSDMYSHMEVLNYGSQVYKVNGVRAKSLLWQDQLALKLAYTAWLSEDLEHDSFIPGLKFTGPQLFFISFAQTHCEKVSELGILQHYVGDQANSGVPAKQRVNGILRSSDEFSNAFHCGDHSYMNPMDKCRMFH